MAAQATGMNNALIETTKHKTQRICGVNKRQLAVGFGLGLIVLLGAFLRFHKLGATSIGNAYYAATVKSMLTSWHNFFFAAYEPGGSVTVDKPPLGFWLQAASAYVFGVNGFSLALPQALAGTLSIPLLYFLVKHQFGQGAGLIAALALAVMPVAVSTERNNTIDGLLIFVLLLAAGAFWQATLSGRLRHLLLGAALVGLGFNIKMLQALLPLPAFYLMYLLRARQLWGKRLLHLGLATIVLVAVSLSWAIAVDLTPAEERPYIGSSSDNTVMELIVGHNGLLRLLPLGGSAPTGNSGPPARPSGAGRPGQLPPDPPPSPPGGQAGRLPPSRPSQGPGPGTGAGNPIAQEVGEPGVLRLFSAPLVTEASWLLPLALLGILLVLVVLGRFWPLTAKHLAVVLWAGWLLPEMLYFSFTSGLFHAYYLIMLGPPLAALVGATAWALWRVLRRRFWLGWALSAIMAVTTLFSQLGPLRSYPHDAARIIIAAVPPVLAGLGLLAATRKRLWLNKAAMALVLAGLMVAPLAWSTLTALNENPDVALPRSGPDMGRLTAMSVTLSPSQEAILDYLLAHTKPNSTLVATLSSHEASPYILATDRPVLTFGGFNGSDDVVDVDQLAEMVAEGDLRYVLGDQELARRKPEIGEWVQTTCTAVEVPGVTASDSAAQGFGPGRGQGTVLFDCGG